MYSDVVSNFVHIAQVPTSCNFTSFTDIANFVEGERLYLNVISIPASNAVYFSEMLT